MLLSVIGVFADLGYLGWDEAVITGRRKPRGKSLSSFLCVMVLLIDVAVLIAGCLWFAAVAVLRGRRPRRRC